MTPAPRPRPSAPLVAWHATRPQSLVVGAAPALVGTAALAGSHQVRWGIAAGCLAVGVLLQAGTNALNDAEDALTGADDTATARPSLAIRAGWLQPGQGRLVAAGCFATAALLGVAVALLSGHPWLLALGAGGIVVGWAYTAPPLRLAYRPLGELASGLPMGLGITWGTAAAQAGTAAPPAAWVAGIPLALLTAGILHANNARDRDHDRSVGKLTLATRLSPAAVAWEYRLLTGLAPLAVVAGLATRALPWECVLALVPGAGALRAALLVRPGLDAAGWTRLLLRCLLLDLQMGVALTVGLALGAIS